MAKEVPSAPHTIHYQGIQTGTKGEQYTGKLVVAGEELKPNKDGVFELTAAEAEELNANGYVCEIVPGSGKKQKA